MTPLEIQIALHYYVSPTDFREGDFSAPAVRSAIDRFQACDLLRVRKAGENGDACYVATPRLNAYVEKLKSIELPIQRWVYPD
jgi:hypothetical protein